MTVHQSPMSVYLILYTPCRLLKRHTWQHYFFRKDLRKICKRKTDFNYESFLGLEAHFLRGTVYNDNIKYIGIKHMDECTG